MNITCVEPLGISESKFHQLRLHYAQMGHTFSYYLDRNEEESELVRRMSESEIVVVSNIKLSATVLSQCPRLRYLSVAFTGLDHIDLSYCASHGIKIENAAGYSTTAVSELAIGMMIDLLRRITTFDGLIRTGAGRGVYLGRELRGKKVGIIGTGAIGTATARLLIAFGAEVVAYSRTERSEVRALGISYLPLNELLSQADIISLHIPLTDATRSLIGREELKLMKPTALLINTARGAVADITAVAHALEQGLIAGAAFDVYEGEPPLPSNHPLLAAPNCLCTPHIAFATEESFATRADIVFGHVDTYLSNL